MTQTHTHSLSLILFLSISRQRLLNKAISSTRSQRTSSAPSHTLDSSAVYSSPPPLCLPLSSPILLLLSSPGLLAPLRLLSSPSLTPNFPVGTRARRGGWGGRGGECDPQAVEVESSLYITHLPRALPLWHGGPRHTLLSLWWLRLVSGCAVGS